jgi:hypothetical protein
VRFSLDLTLISQVKVNCSGGNFQIRVWVAGKAHVLCAPDVHSFVAWVQRFKSYLLEEEVRAEMDVRQLLSASAIDVKEAARGWNLVDTHHAPTTAAEEITSERAPEEDGEWELLSGPSSSSSVAHATNANTHSTTTTTTDTTDVKKKEEDLVVLDVPEARRGARKVAGAVQRLFSARTKVPSTRLHSSKRNTNVIAACQTARSVKKFCRAGGAIDLRDVREMILRTLLVKAGRPRDSPSNEQFTGICARYLALHADALGAAFATQGNRVPRNFTLAMPAFSTKAFDWGLDR